MKLLCVRQLKIKNCEGYDRIPQRFLIDGIDILINPLSQLFSLIYRDKLIPKQWLIALNGCIPLNWLNVSLDTFKVCCEKLIHNS